MSLSFNREFPCFDDVFEGAENEQKGYLNKKITYQKHLNHKKNKRLD